MSDVAKTLEDRDREYGKFSSVANMAQELKRTVDMYDKGDLDNDQREAIDMILLKISRIINGNPKNIDSWHDVAGYATLIENRLLNVSNQLNNKTGTYYNPDSRSSWLQQLENVHYNPGHLRGEDRGGQSNHCGEDSDCERVGYPALDFSLIEARKANETGFSK